jgi:drug/metabolite transporter (DMT)-like permease
MDTPPPTMKSSAALFLQGAVVLIGLAALTFLLGEPHLEGRNAHATLFEIYFKDPFLAYVYVGSIPFFVALYRAFGLFGHVRRNGAFTPATVEALRTIKRCGLLLLGFVAGGVVIILVFGDKEDRPPGLFMGFLAVLGSSAIAVGAAMFARKLQHDLSRPEGSR